VVEVTVAVKSTNDYLERLKKQTAGVAKPTATAKSTVTKPTQFTSSYSTPNAGGTAPVRVNQMTLNQSPDFLKFSNPNEQFAYQQDLRKGGVPRSGTDRLNMAGLQERDMSFAQGSDVATQASTADYLKRQYEANKTLNSFGNTDYSGAIDQALGSFNGDGTVPGLTAEQMNNARLIAEVGKARGLDARGIQIAIMTAMTESDLRNVAGGDRDSVGLFQQRTSQGWGSIAQIMNPNYSAGKFYDELKKGNWRDENPWMEAQHVQRSAYADGSNYRADWSLAQSIYNAIVRPVNPQVGVTNPALKGWIERHNNRYLDFDNAYGAQCVDLYDYYVSGFLGAEVKFVGIAAEIWNNHDTSAFKQVPRSTAARAGDVAIWGVGPGTPGSHVAIVVGDNGDGTLRVLQSNATPQGSRGNSIISNISKGALIGYLRPNKLGR
jgi:hypothetical protein